MSLSKLTGSQVRLINYFDFRLLSDEVEIGRENLDFDPWLLNENGFKPSVPPSGVVDETTHLTFDLTALFGTEDQSGQDIRITYAPGKVTQVRVSFFDGSKTVVRSDDLMGQSAPPSTSVNDYRVAVDPDEFVSDIRIQDDKSGVLDRTFVENVVKILRPANERYFIRWIDFLDQFVTENLRWTVETGTAVPDPDTGTAVLEDGGGETLIQSDEANDATWTEVQASAQFRLRDLAGFGEMRFYVTDADNFYALRIEPGIPAATVKLDRVTATVRTTLASGPFANYHADLLYFLRVATTDLGGGSTQIKFYVDEELIGTVTDSDHAAGKMAIATSTGQRLTITYSELFQSPLESTRVGL